MQCILGHTEMPLGFDSIFKMHYYSLQWHLIILKTQSHFHKPKFLFWYLFIIRFCDNFSASLSGIYIRKHHRFSIYTLHWRDVNSLKNSMKSNSRSVNSMNLFSAICFKDVWIVHILFDTIIRHLNLTPSLMCLYPIEDHTLLQTDPIATQIHFTVAIGWPIATVSCDMVAMDDPDVISLWS
jgi:hypothetical protein